MGVGAAPGVGLDQPDRVVHPRRVAGCESRCRGRVGHRTETVGWDWPTRVPASRPPVGAATSVSSVASGLQQNRSGANGDVPMPAETCSCMWAPHRDAPLARDRSRSQLVTMRAVERQAQLAAVGVAGHHQLVAVGGEAVQHPRLGRVRQRPASGSAAGLGGARDGVVAVALEVRVVDARCGDPQARPPRARGGCASCRASRAR